MKSASCLVVMLFSCWHFDDCTSFKTRKLLVISVIFQHVTGSASMLSSSVCQEHDPGVSDTLSMAISLRYPHPLIAKNSIYNLEKISLLVTTLTQYETENIIVR